MPKPTAAADAAPMPASSRRAFLKVGAALGTVAALAVPVAVLPKAEAAVSDPIFALIAEQRRIYEEFGEVLTGLSEAFDAGRCLGPEAKAEEAEWLAKWEQACFATLSTVPATAAGLLALIDVVDEPHGYGGCVLTQEQADRLCATVRAFAAREAAHV